MPPKPASAARPDSGAPPPKPGGGKRAALAAAAGPAAGLEEAKHKAEALEHRLRAEELARNAAQLERNKIQVFWDITRSHLGDAKAELLVRERDIEEEQDRHALELKVYKQRVKHLLYEHQAAASRLKAEGEGALRQQAELFERQEAQLGDDKRRLRQHVREQEQSTEELIKQFRLDNAKQVSRLRQEFQAAARAIQAKYEAQLAALQRAAEQAYAADLATSEERQASHVAALGAAHAAAAADARAYHSRLTLASLDLIETLKGELAEMKAAEGQRERLVGDVARENRALLEPLGKAVQEAEALRAQVAGAGRDRASLAAAGARLAAAERRARAADWELDVTRQRLEQVQQELTEAQARQEAAVLQAQQRAALGAALLERRLAAATAELAAARRPPTVPGGQPGVGGAVQPAAGPTVAVPAEAAAPEAAIAAGAEEEDAAAAAVPEETEAAGWEPPSAQPAAEDRRASQPGDWVGAALEAALPAPLPEEHAGSLEGGTPADGEEQPAERVVAAGGEPAQPALLPAAIEDPQPGLAPCGKAFAGEAVAAMGAKAAVAEAAGEMAGTIELLIPTHRANQQF